MPSFPSSVPLSQIVADYELYSAAFLKILAMDGRLVPFVWNRPQHRLAAAVRWQEERRLPVRITILKSRKVGVSTWIQGFNFWRGHLRDNRHGVTLAHALDSAQQLFEIQRQFYDGFAALPDSHPLHVRKRRLTRKLISFVKTRSITQVLTVGKGTGRGMTPFELHACFPPDTPILCENGIERRADSVRVGDRIVTHTGLTTKVTGVASRANDETCVLVTPWLGYPVALTPNHRVFTDRGWVSAGDLAIGDRVSMPVRGFGGASPPEIVLSKSRPKGPYRVVSARAGSGKKIEFSHEAGYFFGYYLAEGHVTMNRGGLPAAVTLARDQDEGDYAERAWRAVAHLCSSRRISASKNSRTVCEVFYGAALAQTVAEHFGRVESKHIPDWVFGAGSGFCHGLLVGYLCGDGSKKQEPTDRVSATSIRSSITYQMRDIAASLGVGWARVSKKPAGRRFGRNEQEAWTVSWSGSAARTLREWMGLTTTGRSRPWIEKCELTNGFAWMKLRSLSTVECPQVYDIEVEHSDHSFRTASFSIKNSEIAFWLNANSALAAVRNSVPKEPGTSVFIESTPFGWGSDFHEMWLRAKSKKSGYLPIFISWMDDPRSLLVVPWFKEADLDEEEKELMSLRGATMPQLAWRRSMIEDECGGSVEDFRQEYPSDDVSCWLASGRPAFTSEELTYQTQAMPQPDPYAGLVQSEIVLNTEKQEPEVVPEPRGRLIVLRPPVPRHHYIGAWDPSEGDPGSDASPGVFLDQVDLKVSAVWYGRTPPDVLAEHAVLLCRYFNEAQLIWEANNHGIAFGNRVDDLGYDNVWMRPVSEESVAQKASMKPGYSTRERSRQHLFNCVRSFARLSAKHRWPPVLHPVLVGEMTTLTYEDDKAVAMPGKKIDLLVALGMALFAHRGSMDSPLEPLSAEVVQRALSDLIPNMRIGIRPSREQLDESNLTIEELERLDNLEYELARSRSRKGLGKGN